MVISGAVPLVAMLSFFGAGRLFGRCSRLLFLIRLTSTGTQALLGNRIQSTPLQIVDGSLFVRRQDIDSPQFLEDVLNCREPIADAVPLLVDGLGVITGQPGMST